MQLRKYHIYLIGICILGLAYSWLKAYFSDPVFLVITVACIFAISLVAKRYGK